MRKGISAVIATIMLLMISVSLIGVFYVFSSGITGGATTSGSQQVSQLTSQLSSCMQIDGVNANDNKIYLRNCGKGVIESKALQVFLDDLKISYNLSSVINEGESGELSFYLKSCNEIKKYSGFHTFKITGSAGGLGLLSKSFDTKYQSGVYSIDPDGAGSMQPFQVYCDMERDGGGWTLMLKSWYQAGVAGVTGAMGTVGDATARKGNPYKLSDDAIRAIIGTKQKFDVMADQNGYNSAYSNGNYEYVILRDYTGYWRFDTVVAASSSTTKFQSYRLSDNALAWTGNLKCGVGGWGINCIEVLENNPQGGAGCNINMGKQSDGSWHHFYMSESNTDTYLYICNGAQHSSGFDMNHRWWVREAT